MKGVRGDRLGSTLIYGNEFRQGDHLRVGFGIQRAAFQLQPLDSARICRYLRYLKARSAAGDSPVSSSRCSKRPAREELSKDGLWAESRLPFYPAYSRALPPRLLLPPQASRSPPTPTPSDTCSPLTIGISMPPPASCLSHDSLQRGLKPNSSPCPLACRSVALGHCTLELRDGANF